MHEQHHIVIVVVAKNITVGKCNGCGLVSLDKVIWDPVVVVKAQEILMNILLITVHPAAAAAVGTRGVEVVGITILPLGAKAAVVVATHKVKVEVRGVRMTNHQDQVHSSTSSNNNNVEVIVTAAVITLI